MKNVSYNFGIEPVGIRDNIFNDNIAYINQFDFSRANIDNNSRVHAITSIASICFENPNSIDSSSLYDRLASESKGLPSSSFEFVPVLLTEREVSLILDKLDIREYRNSKQDGYISLLVDDLPVIKFGTWLTIPNARDKYLLTNFRAISYLHTTYDIDLRDRFNTEAECNIIRDNYFVFKFYVDLVTRSQMVRHRANIQERSRRYVSGKKVSFEFYISENMKDLESKYIYRKNTHSQAIVVDTNDVLDICVNHYFAALDRGIKAQEARRIIPQAAYTQLFMGFTKDSLNNYLKLRDDSHAQWEICQTAKAIKNLLLEENSNVDAR